MAEQVQSLLIILLALGVLVSGIDLRKRRI